MYLIKIFKQNTVYTLYVTTENYRNDTDRKIGYRTRYRTFDYIEYHHRTYTIIWMAYGFTINMIPDAITKEITVTACNL